MPLSKNLSLALSEIGRDLGLSRSDLRRVAETLAKLEGSIESDIVRAFLEGDQRNFSAELEGLLFTDYATPRIVVYRFSAVENDDGEAPASEQAVDGRWHNEGADYAPHEFFQNNVDLLRARMDATLTDQARNEAAVAVWISFIAGLEFDDSRSALLFFRDSEGKEDFFISDGSTMLRKPDAAGTVAEILRLGGQDSRSNQGRLAQALREVKGAYTELEALCIEAGVSAPTAKQFEMIFDWISSSNALSGEFDQFTRSIAVPLLDEAHHWMLTGTRGVLLLADRMREDTKQTVQRLEQLHEKRLKGLRADVDKMRVLSDGIKNRADKSDAANRELRQKLKQIEAAAGLESQTVSEESERAGSRVRNALDTLFSR